MLIIIDLKLLEKLCMAHGISGQESEVRNIIISEIKDFVDDIKIDNLGNVIALKKGTSSASKKLMLCAHMDEVGLIVTYVTKCGYVKFSTVGGLDPKILLGKSVFIGGNKISGVIGVKPVHILKPDEKQECPDINDMYIDIGATSKEQALELVSPGDSIVFSSSFLVDNDIIKSKALDDRVGCLILIDMIKKDLQFDAYFSFVTQEEVGLRGSTTAAYTIDPDCAIVVEATTAADIDGNANKVCSVGDGAVISFMDKSTVYDKEYYKLAFDLAKKYNIKAQVKEAVSGGNDAGSIHKSRSGVRTIAVSVPCRYLHTAYSLVSIEDLKNAGNLVLRLAENLAARTS